VKLSSLAKRKRKAAGQKVAPLIATPTVPFLNDTELATILATAAFPTRAHITSEQA
jgi:hypothetical protein